MHRWWACWWLKAKNKIQILFKCLLLEGIVSTLTKLSLAFIYVWKKYELCSRDLTLKKKITEIHFKNYKTYCCRKCHKCGKFNTYKNIIIYLSIISSLIQQNTRNLFQQWLPFLIQSLWWVLMRHFLEVKSRLCSRHIYLSFADNQTMSNDIGAIPYLTSGILIQA